MNKENNTVKEACFRILKMTETTKDRGISHLTPFQKHQGLGQLILDSKKRFYAQAKLYHPERWSKGIRKWELPNYVSLNPIKNKET